MKPEILVFDADGVLVEPWGFARVLEARFGISRKQTRGFFHGAFQDCLKGAADLKDVLPEYLSRWGWRRSLEEFLEIWMRSDDRPRERVLETIRQFRQSDHVCALASNQEPHRAAYMAEQMGFSEVFDALYFSCELGAVKPAPAFYQAIEQDLRAPPSRIHFWDDSPSHVAAARERGWNAYVFRGVESITGIIEPE